VSIPNDYISETAQRLRTYKRISSADSDGALQQIYAEIGDRYGKIPQSVENLFDYARLRKSAERMRVVSVDKTRDGLAIKLGENARVAPEKLMQFLSENSESTFAPSGVLKVAVKAENLIETARGILEKIGG